MQTHRLGRKGYSPGLIGSISITVVEVEVRGRVAQGSYSEAEKHGRSELSYCTHTQEESDLSTYLSFCADKGTPAPD